MSAPAYLMRAAGPDDLEAFKLLREHAGAGFTSLMLDDAGLAAKLDLSAQSFASQVSQPGSERYFIALEHVASGEVVGCCGVKATIGERPPFFNFRMFTEAQASIAAQRRFDINVLIGVNDFTGCTEVGSLFLRAEHRANGVGRALAQSRYMLMAVDPLRFNERVVSELRGVVSKDGHSPFWEAVGRHFFRMEFEEADKLSAVTDNQFILDLMPQHPVYIDLLPESARAVIGKCHPDGEGARKLLEWEGFTFSNVIDIFDGGPLLSAPREMIRTRRHARRVRAEAAQRVTGYPRALAATARLDAFRCIATRAKIRDGAALLSSAALKSLRLEAGEEVLLWVDDAH